MFSSGLWTCCRALPGVPLLPGPFAGRLSGVGRRDAVTNDTSSILFLVAELAGWRRAYAPNLAIRSRGYRERRATECPTSVTVFSALSVLLFSGAQARLPLLDGSTLVKRADEDASGVDAKSKSLGGFTPPGTTFGSRQHNITYSLIY